MIFISNILDLPVLSLVLLITSNLYLRLTHHHSFAMARSMAEKDISHPKFRSPIFTDCSVINVFLENIAVSGLPVKPLKDFRSFFFYSTREIRNCLDMCNTPMALKTCSG